tara:strand:+ start:89 stop:433 length:345 start_codon:yes stop_codon:yes gene_type:complete
MTTQTTTQRSEWYREGYDRGHGIASWVDVPEGLEGCAEYCDACDSEHERVACWMLTQAGEAESHGRQFSPFEDTASDINALEEFDSEAAWEDFDEGISHGIGAEITERLNAYFS